MSGSPLYVHVENDTLRLRGSAFRSGKCTEMTARLYVACKPWSRRGSGRESWESLKALRLTWARMTELLPHAWASLNIFPLPAIRSSQINLRMSRMGLTVKEESFREANDFRNAFILTDCVVFRRSEQVMLHCSAADLFSNKLFLTHNMGIKCGMLP